MSKFTNVNVWLHGLIAAFVSAFATAASGAIALPSVFSFDETGLINMAKLATVPAMLAVFGYLKQSPLPMITVTSTIDKETPSGTESTKSTLTVTKQ